MSLFRVGETVSVTLAFCTVFYCVPLCYLHCIPLCFLHCVPLCSIVFHCVPQCSTVFHCVLLCSTVFQCVPFAIVLWSRWRDRHNCHAGEPVIKLRPERTRTPELTLLLTTQFLRCTCVTRVTAKMENIGVCYRNQFVLNFEL